MSGGQQQLQAVSDQLQELAQQISALETEVETLEHQQSEIDDAVEALENLDTDSAVQVPLGGGAYIQAEIESIDEIIVELGGEYAAERDRDGAIETLSRKRETLDDRIAELEDEIEQLEAESDRLEQQAQQLQQQQLQQQLQGRGDTPDE